MSSHTRESHPLVAAACSKEPLAWTFNHNDAEIFGRKASNFRWKIQLLIMTAAVVATLLVGVILPQLHLSSTNAQILPPSTKSTRIEKDKKLDSTRIIANKALQRLNENVINVPREECKVTVLITRHCNDYGIYANDDAESGDKHCSFVGYERTEYFAQKFESHLWVVENQEPSRRWPLPSALYALLPEKSTQNGGINYRQIEMLLPLAKRTKVSIQVVGTPEQVADSVHNKLQHNGDICGQVMVVAWKHRFIPDVAAALGCGFDQGCYESYPDEEFDVVWQLRFIYEPPAPEDEVLRLLDEGSFLLQDDYGLLADQKKWQEQQQDPDNNENKNGYQHPSATTGWTVYGGRTNQEFDPLYSEYHGEINTGN